MTPDEFREIFPVFADPEKFSGARIEYWLSLGETMIDKARWGPVYSHGIALFAAHNLALELNLSKGGGYGVGGGGPVTSGSKTVGSVSKSESYSTAAYNNAGSYAGTEWGRQLWDLVKQFGAGGMQVNNSCQLRKCRSRSWPIG
ncbi:hypothetical protein FACS1894216_01130 [Synergistales bacterium]|nr:hypothetical protein FACS1894216_01130 [Synergistales bacterium]